MTEITMDTLITEDDRTAYQRGTLAARDDARREGQANIAYSGRDTRGRHVAAGLTASRSAAKTIIDRFRLDDTIRAPLGQRWLCNFHEGPDGHSRWCVFGDQARPPLPFTRRILILMGVSEMTSRRSPTTALPTEGYCDCEMIMNTRTITRRYPPAAWSSEIQRPTATSSA